jgi:hypothetical protein
MIGSLCYHFVPFCEVGVPALNGAGWFVRLSVSKMHLRLNFVITIRAENRHCYDERCRQYTGIEGHVTCLLLVLAAARL